MYIPFTSARQVARALESQSGVDPQKSWMLCPADAHGEQPPEPLAGCAAREIHESGGVFPAIIAPKGVENSGVIARLLLAGSQTVVSKLSESGVSFNAPLPEFELLQATSASVIIDCLSPVISQLMEDMYSYCGSSV